MPSYDEVPYPNLSHVQSHPDALATQRLAQHPAEQGHRRTPFDLSVLPPYLLDTYTVGRSAPVYALSETV